MSKTPTGQTKMISKAEHQIAQNKLLNLAETVTASLTQAIAEVTSKDHAFTLAKVYIEHYHTQGEVEILNGLRQVGRRAAEHYNQVLTLGLEGEELEALVEDLLREQLVNPYHGANLEQRLFRTKMISMQRLRKASVTGSGLETRKANLTRHLLHKYPYGAQLSVDKRVLLAQAVYLEHEIAKNLAKKAEVRYAVWTLSHQHSTPDICDHLARQVDPSIKEALANTAISPEGVYTLKNLPALPHPNCRCTLRFIHEGSVTPKTSQRTKEAFNWLRRILQKTRLRVRPRI